MVEFLREVKISIMVDTNKRTIYLKLTSFKEAVTLFQTLARTTNLPEALAELETNLIEAGDG